MSYSDNDGSLDAGPIFKAKEIRERGDPDARRAIIAEVLGERERQIYREGWDRAHDDEHYNGEMASAAASYAAHGQFPGYAQKMWPWDSTWWKPTTDRRDLIKAAALIVAEIERLDRLNAPPSNG